ncbi:hypothetical protein MNBD_NITROSPINAE05-403 [hydrothermal vent metagenome]|uniref:Lipoprotein n=1 Tax=hydrothermal vent metagenome TaxID=652676 RepID=A0A3B1CWR7_9ZZZZ
MFFSPKHVFSTLICCLAFVSCSSPKVQVSKFLTNNSASPKSVAILPFTLEDSIQKKEKEFPHIIFREVFFNNFSYLGYNDMALDEVDQKLHHAGVQIENASKLRYRELKEILGVDSVVIGHIIEANNFTGGLYSETLLRAKIEMIDLNTGNSLWEVDHTEMDYSGIASPTIVDIIQEQVENAKVTQAYQKNAEMFSQRIISQIPDPAGKRLEEVSLPSISSIETNIRPNQKLKPDDSIYVSMRGQPKLNATFDIGSWKTSIPMKEVSPGLYTGSYVIKQEDKVLNAFIIGTLKNLKGLASKKYFKTALATTER